MSAQTVEPAAEGIMCGVSAVCLVRFRRGLTD